MPKPMAAAAPAAAICAPVTVIAAAAPVAVTMYPSVNVELKNDPIAGAAYMNIAINAPINAPPTASAKRYPFYVLSCFKNMHNREVCILYKLRDYFKLYG